MAKPRGMLKSKTLGNFKGKCVCKTISHICKSTTSNFMNKDDQEALLVILCLIGFITVYKFIKKKFMESSFSPIAFVLTYLVFYVAFLFKKADSLV